MNPTTWLVQTNITPESPTHSLLLRACSEQARPCIAITVLPGSRTPPPVPAEAKGGPVVFHGRSTLILNALASPWRHGVFFDPATFNHQAYALGFGDRLLNYGATVMTWAELLKFAEKSSGYRFVKPNNDFKGFTGQAISLATISELFQSLSTRNRECLLDTEVVVADAHEVDAEWRLFVVNGKIITGSMYRPTGSAYLPSDVVEFATSAIESWVPASVFALDVGRVGKQLRVVECNCFNASRLYHSDVSSLVKAVSDFQEASYADLPSDQLATMT